MQQNVPLAPSRSPKAACPLAAQFVAVGHRWMASLDRRRKHPERRRPKADRPETWRISDAGRSTKVPEVLPLAERTLLASSMFGQIGGNACLLLVSSAGPGAAIWAFRSARAIQPQTALHGV